MPRSPASISRMGNHEGGKLFATTALLIAVGPTWRTSDIFFRPTASANLDGVIMVKQYPLMVDNCKTTICGLLISPHFVNFLPMKEVSREFTEVGARLKATRLAFSDLKQSAWAEKHGFQPTQWNNWEKGMRRIPVDNAEKLCDLYGLTLDFIYRGRLDGLSEKAAKSF